MQPSAPDPQRTASPALARLRLAITVVAALAILGTVYQTLVLTGLVNDTIRRALSYDKRDQLWAELAWGVPMLYGLFGSLAVARRLGSRDTLVIGLGFFAAGNFLCGAATDLASFCGGRAIEGIGKGMTIGLLRNYLYGRFDRMFLGAVLFYGIFAYASRPFSPWLAVELTESFSWRWVWWMNVPVCLFSMGLLLCLPSDRPAPDGPRGESPKVDLLLVNLLVCWVVSLMVVTDKGPELGGFTSNAYLLMVTTCAALGGLLVLRFWFGMSAGEHARRILASRVYVLAITTRMLLILQLAAVLGVLGQYMTELRQYPRGLAGTIFFPAGPAMLAGTLLCSPIRSRRLRHLTLLTGVLGTAAAIWWLAAIDLGTDRRQLAIGVGVWGFFLGMLPASFLIDEVEGIERRDMPYAGLLAVVALVVPLVIVPSVMSSAVNSGADAAYAVQRRSVRAERPPVVDTLARATDRFAVRGDPPPTSAAGAVVTVAALVKLRSAATGVQSALATLAIFCASLGGVTALSLLVFRYNWPQQRFSR